MHGVHHRGVRGGSRPNAGPCGFERPGMTGSWLRWLRHIITRRYRKWAFPRLRRVTSLNKLHISSPDCPFCLSSRRTACASICRACGGVVAAHHLVVLCLVRPRLEMPHLVAVQSNTSSFEGVDAAELLERSPSSWQGRFRMRKDVFGRLPQHCWRFRSAMRLARRFQTLPGRSEEA